MNNQSARVEALRALAKRDDYEAFEAEHNADVQGRGAPALRARAALLRALADALAAGAVVDPPAAPVKACATCRWYVWDTRACDNSDDGKAAEIDTWSDDWHESDGTLIHGAPPCPGWEAQVTG